MKVAALDLGSNTFLCLIAEVDANGIKKVYSDSLEVVQLGQGLNNSKHFHPEALQRAEICLQKFERIIKAEKPEKILAMATSAARDAENREDLFHLGMKYSIPIEIIPGDQEALITYQGATSGIQTERNILVIDIGGGSTEFIFGQGKSIVAGESYNIGCVRLTEKFIHNQPTPHHEVEQASAFIREHIMKAKLLNPHHFNIEEIIAVAGTPTTLVAAELGRFDANQIDGFKLTELRLQKWLSQLTTATVEEKVAMGIPAGRADVILIGVITLLETLKIFNQTQLTVSTRGVRYGIALEMGRRFLPVSDS